jgi:hypothetical protein
LHAVSVTGSGLSDDADAAGASLAENAWTVRASLPLDARIRGAAFTDNADARADSEHAEILSLTR